MSLLSDSESDEISEINNKAIQINEKFAGEFERRERRKELSRADELLKKGLLPEDSDEEDSESEESEDEDAEMLSSKLDLQIFQTINSLRRKDPEIYDSNKQWFNNDEVTESSDSDDDAKPTKKKVFKDIAREQLLEQMNNGGAADEELHFENARRFAYDAEQEDIRQQFLRFAGAENRNPDDIRGEDSDEDILKVKTSSKKDNNMKEEKLLSAIDEWKSLASQDNNKSSNRSGPDVIDTVLEEVNNDPEQFLASYMKNKSWKFLDTETTVRPNVFDGNTRERLENFGGFHGEGEHDEVKDDESEVEEMEKFESKYNFRFQELEAESNGASLSEGIQVVGHARNVEGSLRRVDDKRKVQREERKQRKERERRQKEAELRRLKNLKRQELKDRMSRIYDIAGIDKGSFPVEDDEEIDEELLQRHAALLDEDWDPEKHDALMLTQFGDSYYAQSDDLFDPEAGDADEVDNFDETDYANDGDTDLLTALSDKKETGRNRKTNKHSKEEELEVEEELYKLDYEDIVGGIPCRFKYRQVEPESYGLSVEEILLADDPDLNKYVGLKKLAPYRQGGNHRSYDEDNAVLSKKRKKFRASLREKLAEQAAQAEAVGAQLQGTQPNSKNKDDHDGEDNGSKKRRRRKRKKAEENGDTNGLRESSGQREFLHLETNDHSSNKQKRKKKEKNVKVKNKETASQIEKRLSLYN